MRKNLIGSTLLAAFLILFCQILSAQSGETFRLIHSDFLNLSTVQNEQILQLNGRVHFFYGKIEFKSQRAIIWEKQKIVRLFDSVCVSTDTLTLVADSVAYYRIPEQLRLGGNIRVTESKPDGTFRWITSDHALYDKKQNRLTVWDRVRAFDQQEYAYVSCNYAFWDRNQGYAYMVEEPEVSGGSPDTLRIKAGKMEYFEQDRKLIATFNVQTSTNEYQAKSDFLIHFLREEKAVFTGKPVFYSDFATAEAVEFYVYLQNRKIQTAELVDSCRVRFSGERDTKQENWVTASFIKISFQDDKIRHFTAEEMVNYFFVQPPRERRDFFINSASGDYLEANFNDDNKLERMEMRRNIRGKYVFENRS